MRKKLFFLSLLGMVLLVFTACGLDNIAEIKADPFRYQQKQAHLGGIVTKSYGILNYGLYEIQDRSGTLLVVSTGGVPAEGSKVEVKGHTKTAFVLAGIDHGLVLVESNRKIHK